ncbi:Gfo/Idh/MocA family protein [Phytoactinopolyspora alkaliphila]|nr:Gfo/Idh/MocA family oxidoreductase [Phytoactinopolyspora alkaliphila]
MIQVGAGAMGLAWLRTIAESPDAEVVGLVDLDIDVARRSAETAGLPDLPTATSLAALADTVAADAVVNVTIPEAHHPVNLEAMSAGFPVLCEKPIAPTVAGALSMVAASEATGRLLMISQSRRYFAGFAELRRLVESLGVVGTVTCEFFKAPHFGGFRERMAHPLLVDMAIHHFDAARHLVGQEPVAVYCQAYNPPWSWYDGDAAATAVFEFSGGAQFVYTGSWCSPGYETSWNGRWRISAQTGSALWDGDGSPTVDMPGRTGTAGEARRAPAVPEQISGALAEFVHALRTGTTPSGEAHGNVLSLAMVESAVQSALTGTRTVIEDVLADAHAQATDAEQHDAVRAVLKSWRDVRETVGLPAR